MLINKRDCIPDPVKRAMNEERNVDNESTGVKKSAKAWRIRGAPRR